MGGGDRPESFAAETLGDESLRRQTGELPASSKSGEGRGCAGSERMLSRIDLIAIAIAIAIAEASADGGSHWLRPPLQSTSPP